MEKLISSSGLEQFYKAQTTSSKIDELHADLMMSFRDQELLDILTNDPNPKGKQFITKLDSFMAFMDPFVVKSKLIPAEISGVHPDWVHLVAELQSIIKNRGSWNDFYAGSMGQTMLELVAAMGVYNQLFIERAYRESFLSTAVRDTSVYALANMLGVRVARRDTAKVLVRLKNLSASNARVIPYNTKFEVGGKTFFAANSYTVYPKSTNDWSNVECDDPTVKVEDNTLVLHEGVFYQKEMVVSDDPKELGFFQIRLNEPNWQVANSHLLMTVNDENWKEASDPLWMYNKDSTVFFSTTSGDGDVIITFGDGLFGKLPKYGDRIVVGYMKTSGILGNNQIENQTVMCQTISSLTGVTKGGVMGGSEQKSAMYYKMYAPHVFKARGRAITKTDYRAVILTEWTGGDLIASLAVQGQRDIARFDLRWMNTVRISILPPVFYQKNTDTTQLQAAPSFATSINSMTVGEADYNNVRFKDNDVAVDHLISDGEINGIINWLGDRNHYMIDTVYKHPIKHTVSLKVELAVLRRANVSLVVENAVRSIKNLFYRKLDTLGKDILISDVMRACLVTNVDYAVLYEIKTKHNEELLTVTTAATEPGWLSHRLSNVCSFNSLTLYPQTTASSTPIALIKETSLDNSKKVAFYNNKLYFKPNYATHIFKAVYDEVIETKGISDFVLPKNADRELSFFELGSLIMRPFFSER